jgi:hypothetical protein
VKVLVYGESLTERAAVNRGLESLGCGPLIEVERWDDVLASIVAERPELAVISYATLAGLGDALVQTSALTLRAIGVPVVVAVDALYASVIDDISSQTDFTHFVVAPYNVAALSASIAEATGKELFERGNTNVTSDYDAVMEQQARTMLSVAEAGSLPTRPVRVAPSLSAGFETEEVQTFDGPDFDDDEFESPFPRSGGFAAVDEPGLSLGEHLGSSDEFDGLSASGLLSTVSRGTGETLEAAPDSGLSTASRRVDSAAHFAVGAGSGASARPTNSGTPVETDGVSGVSRVSGVSLRSSGAIGSGAERRVFVSGPLGGTSLVESGSGQSIAERMTPVSGVDGVSVGVAVQPPFDNVTPVAQVAVQEKFAATVTSVDHVAERAGLELVTQARLLPPDSGTFEDFPVAAVLHGLTVRRLTGEVILQNESLTRRIILLDGALGSVFQAPSAEEERKVLGTIGWTAGLYEFREIDVPESQFYPYGDSLELLFRAMQRHLGINELAVSLQSVLKTYPRATDQASRLVSILGLEPVQQFSQRCTGLVTLESILASAGAATEATMQCAYFAELTGVVVLCDEATEYDIELVFEDPAPVVQASRPSMRATATASPLERAAVSQRRTGTAIAESSGRVSAVQPRLTSQAAEATVSGEDSTANHRDTFQKLNGVWGKVSAQDGYDTFGVVAGCGVDAVNARFYELVREYHPDRYAHSQSTQIKALAEKIFLEIRSLHSELIAREEGGGSSPNSNRASSMGRANRGVASNGGGGSSMGNSVSVRSGESGVGTDFDRVASSGQTTVPPGSADLGDSGSGENVRSRRMARRSAGSRLTASQSTVRGPRRRTAGVGGEAKSVGDTVSQMRDRVAEPPDSDAPDEFSRGSSGSFNSLTQARRLAPDQLLRNAKKAVANGAEEKAYDLMELAKAKGLDTPEIHAYVWYFKARFEEEPDVKVLEALETIAEEDKVDKRTKSQALMLAGHVHRFAEQWKQASNKYDRSVSYDNDNQESARWARYAKKRIEEDGGKSGLGFLNKLKLSFKTK